MPTRREARLARAMAMRFAARRRDGLRRGGGQAGRAAGAGLSDCDRLCPWGRRLFDAGARRRRADPQPRRLGGAARPAADAWRGRRRSTSRKSRSSRWSSNISPIIDEARGAEAGDRRRLSRHGGVARLPQILPAAAQDPEADPEPRGTGAAAAAAAAAARRDARGGRAADRPRPDRPRRVRARRARRACGWCASRQWQASAFDLFAAYGRVRARTQPAMHVVAHRAVMTLEDAIQRVSALIGAGARLDHA